MHAGPVTGTDAHDHQLWIAMVCPVFPTRGTPARSRVGQSLAKKTFFTSVNESSASGPSSRPSPDCLNPPNGVEYRTEECELTDRLPDSTARATRSARPTSRVQIDPDRPYSVSL